MFLLKMSLYSVHLQEVDREDFVLSVYFSKDLGGDGKEFPISRREENLHFF
jgi:hypothetical protein